MLAAQEFLFDLNPQLLFDAALLAIAVFFLYMLMSYLLFNPCLLYTSPSPRDS